MHPWDWPERPWQRIHLDYAGPFMGKMFLIAVNAHSKWMEVEIVNSATIQATIEHLRASFGRFGVPEVVVTDNGTCLPVVNSRSLPSVTISNMRGLLPTILLPMAWLSMQFKLSSWA